MRQEHLLASPPNATKALQPAAACPAGSPGPSPEPVQHESPACETPALQTATLRPAASAAPAPEQPPVVTPEGPATACPAPPAADAAASGDLCLATAQEETLVERGNNVAAMGSGSKGAAAEGIIPAPLAGSAAPAAAAPAHEPGLAQPAQPASSRDTGSLAAAHAEEPAAAEHAGKPYQAQHVQQAATRDTGNPAAQLAEGNPAAPAAGAEASPASTEPDDGQDALEQHAASVPSRVIEVRPYEQDVLPDFMPDPAMEVAGNGRTADGLAAAPGSLPEPMEGMAQASGPTPSLGGVWGRPSVLGAAMGGTLSGSLGAPRLAPARMEGILQAGGSQQDLGEALGGRFLGAGGPANGKRACAEAAGGARCDLPTPKRAASGEGAPSPMGPRPGAAHAQQGAAGAHVGMRAAPQVPDAQQAPTPALPLKRRGGEAGMEPSGSASKRRSPDPGGAAGGPGALRHSPVDTECGLGNPGHNPAAAPHLAAQEELPDSLAALQADGQLAAEGAGAPSPIMQGLPHSSAPLQPHSQAAGGKHVPLDPSLQGSLYSAMAQQTDRPAIESLSQRLQARLLQSAGAREGAHPEADPNLDPAAADPAPERGAGGAGAQAAAAAGSGEQAQAMEVQVGARAFAEAATQTDDLESFAAHALLAGRQAMSRARSRSPVARRVASPNPPSPAPSKPKVDPVPAKLARIITSRAPAAGGLQVGRPPAGAAPWEVPRSEPAQVAAAAARRAAPARCGAGASNKAAAAALKGALGGGGGRGGGNKAAAAALRGALAGGGRQASIAAAPSSAAAAAAATSGQSVAVVAGPVNPSPVAGPADARPASTPALGSEPAAGGKGAVSPNPAGGPVADGVHCAPETAPGRTAQGARAAGLGTNPVTGPRPVMPSKPGLYGSLLSAAAGAQASGRGLQDPAAGAAAQWSAPARDALCRPGTPGPPLGGPPAMGPLQGPQSGARAAHGPLSQLPLAGTAPAAGRPPAAGFMSHTGFCMSPTGLPTWRPPAPRPPPPRPPSGPCTTRAPGPASGGDAAFGALQRMQPPSLPMGLRAAPAAPRPPPGPGFGPAPGMCWPGAPCAPANSLKARFSARAGMQPRRTLAAPPPRPPPAGPQPPSGPCPSAGAAMGVLGTAVDGGGAAHGAVPCMQGPRPPSRPRPGSCIRPGAVGPGAQPYCAIFPSLRAWSSYTTGT